MSKPRLVKVPSDKAKVVEKGLLIPVGGDLLHLRGKWLCVKQSESKSEPKEPDKNLKDKAYRWETGKFVLCDKCKADITFEVNYGHPEDDLDTGTYCQNCFNNLHGSTKPFSTFKKPEKDFPLRILFARYGYSTPATNRWRNVTFAIRQALTLDQVTLINIDANDKSLAEGSTAPSIPKQLVVIYEAPILKDDGEISDKTVVRKMIIAQSRKLVITRNFFPGQILDHTTNSIEILNAYYGDPSPEGKNRIDVSDIIRRHFLTDGKGFFVSDASLDLNFRLALCPNKIRKILIVNALLNGQFEQFRIVEGEYMNITFRQEANKGFEMPTTLPALSDKDFKNIQERLNKLPKA